MENTVSNITSAVFQLNKALTIEPVTFTVALPSAANSSFCLLSLLISSTTIGILFDIPKKNVLSDTAAAGNSRTT